MKTQKLNWYLFSFHYLLNTYFYLSNTGGILIIGRFRISSIYSKRGGLYKRRGEKPFKRSQNSKLLNSLGVREKNLKGKKFEKLLKGPKRRKLIIGVILIKRESGNHLKGGKLDINKQDHLKCQKRMKLVNKGVFINSDAENFLK